jgi:general secretion pathway protein D
VDVRPLQVLIEATVAYVRRDFTFSYGVRGTTGDIAVPGSSNTTVGGESVGASSVAGVQVRAFNLGGIDLDLVLTAGQNRSSVIILDRPLVIAANNEEAEIVVGEQRPFVQVQRSTDGGVLDEVVQYKDVGTVLRVLPTISGDGYVQMHVVQEVNSAGGSAPGLAAPVISTRSIQTQLLVRDGHTVVMGGLSGRQRDRARGGIPFLSDLPLIGGIFGSRGREDTDFELFVFITPHVLYTDDDMLDATGEVRGRPSVRRATRGVQPFVTPPPADGDAAPPPAEPGSP